MREESPSINLKKAKVMFDDQVTERQVTTGNETLGRTENDTPLRHAANGRPRSSQIR